MDAATPDAADATAPDAAPPDGADTTVRETPMGAPDSYGTEDPSVLRVIYAVPTDRAPTEAVRRNIAATVNHAQMWLRDQLGNGQSFVWTGQVELLRLSKSADTFKGDGAVLSWYYNVKDELTALIGSAFSDPQRMWLVFVDSDENCGQISQGALTGMAIIPANSIRGLVREWPRRLCNNETLYDRCVYNGAVAHELMHGMFELSHPPGCDTYTATPYDNDALLCFGFLKYPNTYLLDKEKQTIKASSFLRPVPKKMVESCNRVAEEAP